MTPTTLPTSEVKSGKLTLTPEAPTTPTTPGDPPPPPAVFPPSGTKTVNGVAVIPTVNGVPQTQLPSLPYGATAR